MSFKELRTQPELSKLDSLRAAVLSCLDTFKEGLEALPTDKLSMRSFSKYEANIEEEIANLKSIDKKIVGWLSAKGGDRDDSDFVEYRKESSMSLSTIEKAQSNYFDLLLAADMVPKEKPDMSNDLVGLLKSLTYAQNANQEILKSLKDTQKAAV